MSNDGVHRTGFPRETRAVSRISEGERRLNVEPQVSIVVVPRERFSLARKGLERLLQHTALPFNLIYVDGGSPPTVQRYLRTQAERKNFRLLRTDHYLSPNQARNLGLRLVESKYLVFLDNDVFVTPGWLEALVECADTTDAWVVAPLYCVGDPEPETVHMGGGRVHIQEDGGKRYLSQRHDFAGVPLQDALPHLHRQPTGYAEFHCVLAKTEVFRRLGPLDEGLPAVYEHLDFALNVREAGGSIYLEPRAIVTYVDFPVLDLRIYFSPFFLLRWSDARIRRSIDRFREKWRLSDDDPALPKTYFGFTRYRQGYLRPLRWRGGPLGRRLSETVLQPLEIGVNRWLINHFPRPEKSERDALLTAGLPPARIQG